MRILHVEERDGRKVVYAAVPMEIIEGSGRMYGTGWNALSRLGGDILANAQVLGRAESVSDQRYVWREDGSRTPAPEARYRFASSIDEQVVEVTVALNT